MESFKYACVVALMCMVVLSAPIAEAISCDQVGRAVTPCVPYLKSGGTPPNNCCIGMRSLASMATTTADRRVACNCLKAFAVKLPSFNAGFGISLPGKCGVTIPYKFSTSTNCATIN